MYIDIEKTICGFQLTHVNSKYKNRKKERNEGEIKCGVKNCNRIKV